MAAYSAAVGLEWKRIFEQLASSQEAHVYIKKAIVFYLKSAAVSSYFTTQDPVLVISLKEDLIQRSVIDVIEWFLFGEDPEKGRLKLTGLNNPPTLCGKVFKHSEPTYSCRDCALDATCVLCMACFGRSIHKDHNYRLNTSAGGGCCDCGDVEAWTKGASCELHSARSKKSDDEEDPSKKLPEDLSARGKCLFTILLDFCVKFICDPNEEEILIDLETVDEQKSHVTMLYNDESHTFNGVIVALKKAVPACTTKLGNDFATVVDREGRSSLYIGTRQKCNEICASVQRSTDGSSGPLRCETAHIYTAVCQLLALRLMTWLTDITEESECLRRLHSVLSTTNGNDRLSHLTTVLQADARLWKMARLHSHQLFMNTLLKDSFGKVTLAIEFTKNYPIIMNDFYADDQDHSISAAVMSVQLFTVPSLAQMLTINYDLMEIVMGVLLDKTRSFLGDNGLLEFSRDEHGKSIRLYWVMHDLRYIVQNKPNEWTESLKEKFYRFVELFLFMFRRFQGAGMMKRATGIHVEIEPEWHRDFDFEYRLSELVPFIIKWCESDRDVLLKSIALTLSCLQDVRKSTGATKLKKHHEGKKSMKLFDFDVSSGKVSMHIPVVRFLASLIGCCERFSINIPDVLGIKKDEDALMYMEYPLKVLVFAAQVKSGMWKKNGYSVLHQVHAYCKDSSATETYDKDIFFMQVLASFMDKDYFLHVVVDMFKLLPWSSSSYDVDKINETALNHQLSLASEFFHLMIIILGERYNSVVGQVENESELRREVIHRLCLGNMSRSELMRGLPLSESRCQREGKIDGVIASVAIFKKPGLSRKGMYKIKKEFLSEFNPYFYHYDKNEQSKAEDQQRKRCKEEDMPAVFAPPVPVEFLPKFSSVVELLTAKKMIEMLTVVLSRIKSGNPKSWTDRIFHQVLYLVGLALHEEARQRNNGQSFGFIDVDKKRFLHVPKHFSLVQCLEDLQGNPNVQAHIGLLTWTIQKLNEELSTKSNFEKLIVESSPAMKASETVSHDEEKLEKQRLAKERRERILLQMSNMQKAFIRENPELYHATNTDVEESMSDQTDSAVTSSSEHVPVVAIGNNRTHSITVPSEQFICILCQENPSSNDRPLVYSSYVQRSTVLSSDHGQALEQGEKADPLVSHRDQRVGTHVGSCGHVMHGDCWQRFFESMLANDRLSLRFRIRNTFDLVKREFLCPLCSSLGNTVLPIISPTLPKEEESKSKYVSWFASFRKIESMLTNDLVEFSQNKESESEGSLFKKLLNLKGKILPLIYGTELSTDMQSMINVFTRAAFTFGLNVQPDDDDCRVSLMVWATCAYTIQCFEHSSREESRVMVNSSRKRQVDVLKSLVCLANSVCAIAKSHDIVSHCLRLLSVLSGCKQLPSERRSLMDVDLFDWMVKMRFSLPSISCSGDSTKLFAADETSALSSIELDGFVFHLALVASIVQLLITTSEDIPSDEMDDCNVKVAGLDTEKMATLWGKLRVLCNLNTQSSSHPRPQRLLLHIRYRLLPFLRCCAMFFHILNSTRVPLALRESFASMDKEYEALAEYLALPRDLTELLTWSVSEKMFADDVVSKIVTWWCTNVNLEAASQSLVSSILTQKSLIKLPNDYSELISQASQYDCPVFSGEENRIPAICLICGKWLCCEAWCCKQTIGDKTVGSCTAHAQTCGAGVGIFLRARDCLILFLNGIGKGCFYPSPYLDAYGETDPGLRRGNPLYLCEERFQQLQKLWKEHSIASEIVRHLETNRHLMQFDWMNF